MLGRGGGVGLFEASSFCSAFRCCHIRRVGYLELYYNVKVSEDKGFKGRAYGVTINNMLAGASIVLGLGHSNQYMAVWVLETSVWSGIGKKLDSLLAGG